MQRISEQPLRHVRYQLPGAVDTDTPPSSIRGIWLGSDVHGVQRVMRLDTLDIEELPEGVVVTDCCWEPSQELRQRMQLLAYNEQGNPRTWKETRLKGIDSLGRRCWFGCGAGPVHLQVCEHLCLSQQDLVEYLGPHVPLEVLEAEVAAGFTLPLPAKNDLPQQHQGVRSWRSTTQGHLLADCRLPQSTGSADVVAGSSSVHDTCRSNVQDLQQHLAAPADQAPLRLQLDDSVAADSYLPPCLRVDQQQQQAMTVSRLQQPVELSSDAPAVHNPLMLIMDQGRQKLEDYTSQPGNGTAPSAQQHRQQYKLPCSLECVGPNLQPQQQRQQQPCNGTFQVLQAAPGEAFVSLAGIGFNSCSAVAVGHHHPAREIHRPGLHDGTAIAAVQDINGQSCLAADKAARHWDACLHENSPGSLEQSPAFKRQRRQASCGLHAISSEGTQVRPQHSNSKLESLLALQNTKHPLVEPHSDHMPAPSSAPADRVLCTGFSVPSAEAAGWHPPLVMLAAPPPAAGAAMAMPPAAAPHVLQQQALAADAHDNQDNSALATAILPDDVVAVTCVNDDDEQLGDVKLLVTSLLGVGGHGAAYLATLQDPTSSAVHASLEPGMQLVIKVPLLMLQQVESTKQPPVDTEEADEYESMKNEYMVMDEVKECQAVVTCYGFGRLQHCSKPYIQLPALLLEYCNLGSWDDLRFPGGLRNRAVIKRDSATVHHIMKSLVPALTFLGDVTILHSDIKSGSIMLKGRSLGSCRVGAPAAATYDSVDEAFPFVVKLADFGCARYSRAGLAQTKLIGTRAFHAPEMGCLGYTNYSSLADFYTAALCFLVGRTGVPSPFSYISRGFADLSYAEAVQVASKRLKDLQQVYGKDFCPRELEFATGSLQANPTERWTAYAMAES